VTAKAIQDVFAVSAHSVYAGVNAKLFHPFVRSSLQKKYQDWKVVVHSTDYSPVKKTDELIKVFAAVVKKIPNAKLCITSTIENETAKTKLQKLAHALGIQKNIDFLGFVSITDLPQYYSLAIVFVQMATSAKSGTSSMALPVKEAMCCGTPAIRPDVGGEDVADGISGFLMSSKNRGQLANKIVYLLAHPQEAKIMGKKARTAIIGKYSWEATAKNIFQYLK